MNSIDKAIRLTNYLIDLAMILIVWFLIALIFRNSYVGEEVLYLLMFFYYLLLESILGQTIGKIVTKTSVVKKDGRRANFLNILIRTVLRFIPIDAFSYLFGTERGFHDVLSSTKLIKKVI